MSLQFFSRKLREQVLANKGKQKGEAEQKSHATSTQCFPPFWANLLFEQQPKSQRARCFGWSSTRLCQPHSTPQLQNSLPVFTDAILSKPFPQRTLPPVPLLQSQALLHTTCFHHISLSASPSWYTLWTVIDENMNAPNSSSCIF